MNDKLHLPEAIASGKTIGAKKEDRAFSKYKSFFGLDLFFFAQSFSEKNIVHIVLSFLSLEKLGKTGSRYPIIPKFELSCV